MSSDSSRLLEGWDGFAIFPSLLILHLSRPINVSRSSSLVIASDEANGKASHRWLFKDIKSSLGARELKIYEWVLWWIFAKWKKKRCINLSNGQRFAHQETARESKCLTYKSFRWHSARVASSSINECTCYIVSNYKKNIDSVSLSTKLYHET